MRDKVWKLSLVVGLLAVLVGAGCAKREPVVYELITVNLTASELFARYVTDPQRGDEEYKEKAILVTGLVTDIQTEGIVLGGKPCPDIGVRCQGERLVVSIGDYVTLRGRVVGLFTNVELVDCKLIETLEVGE